jgi:REP element-mobilizing transposase RayT
MKTLQSSAHSVGESNLHLQFTPAYRQDVFESRVLRDVVTSLLVEQAEKLEITLAAFDYGPDHLHLFVTDWKRWSVSSLAQRFKGAVSYELRKNYSYLFDDKKYVQESQIKHWQQQETTTQKTILNYN